MRAVLDSNIFFSALISSTVSPDVIYRAWRASRFEVVTSRMQLDEIRRASRYAKFQATLRPAKVGAMINYLRRAVVLERLNSVAETDDPDDAFLLAMAVEGEADYLVTGDHRAGILQLGHIGRARIVTPTQFREEVLLSLAQPSPTWSKSSRDKHVAGCSATQGEALPPGGQKLGFPHCSKRCRVRDFDLPQVAGGNAGGFGQRLGQVVQGEPAEV